MSAYPYWRLSSFYFWYFAALGIWVPFWGLYLESLSFSAQAIGALTAILSATKIFAPNVWDLLVDRFGHRLFIVQLGAFFSCLCFAGIFFDQSFWWLAVVVALFSFFWNAILSQFEVLTLTHLGQWFNRYSRVRVWGSLGFIIAVVLLGWVFERVGIGWFPVLLLLALGLMWLCSLAIPATPDRAMDRESRGVWVILRKPSVIVFLICSFLLQVAHGPYYTFFSIFLEKHGYSKVDIGLLWALGVFAEVILFLFMHRLLPVTGASVLLIWSLALAAVRWLLIAYGVESLPVMLFAQCLHAASFGSAHAAAIEFIRREFPGRAQGSGQALYSGVSFGSGGALGAFLSGYIWTVNPQQTFVMAAAVSVLAWLLALRWLRDDATIGAQ